MPYLTLAENLKLQLSPGLVASYDIQLQETEWVYSGTNTHTRLLTYLLAPDPHRAPDYRLFNTISNISQL